MIKGKKLVVFLLCIAMSLPILAWGDEAAELRKKIMFDQKKTDRAAKNGVYRR